MVEATTARVVVEVATAKEEEARAEEWPMAASAVEVAEGIAMSNTHSCL